MIMLKTHNKILLCLSGVLIGGVAAVFGIRLALMIVFILLLGILILADYQRSVYILALYVLIDYVVRHLLGSALLSGIWDELLFIGLLFIWIYKLIQHKKAKYKWTPLDLPIALFILVGIVLMLFKSPNLLIAIEGLRAVVQYILWYYIAVQLVDTTETAIKVYWILVLLGSLLGLHGIYQYIMKVPMPGNWVDSAENIRTRAFSIVGSPNILGSLLVLLIPMSLALFVFEKNKLRKLVALGTAVIMSGALFATMSRGAWVGAALAVILFLLFKNRKLIFPALVLGSIFIFFVPSISERLSYMFTDEYLFKSSEGGRIYRWLTGIEAWSESKWLGLGLGRYGGAVATNHNLSPFYMDNYYIKTLAEMGLVGLGAFLLLLWQLLKSSYHAIVYQTNLYKKELMIGLFCGMIGVLVQNFFENIFEVPMMVTYFWICAGLLMVLRNSMDKRNTVILEE